MPRTAPRPSNATLSGIGSLTPARGERLMVGTMRIALYARVSTTDQSCEMQLRELHDYVATRGWEVSEEYVDTGWSGAKTRRPALDPGLPWTDGEDFLAVAGQNDRLL